MDSIRVRICPTLMFTKLMMFSKLSSFLACVIQTAFQIDHGFSTNIDIDLTWSFRNEVHRLRQAYHAVIYDGSLLISAFKSIENTKFKPVSFGF